MRWLPFTAVTCLVVGVLWFALFFTERSWTFAERPVVASLDKVAADPEGVFRKSLDDYGLHLVRPQTMFDILVNGRKLPPDEDDSYNPGKPGQLFAGRSIREYGVLGMPFGWSTEYGDVVYYRTDRETVYSALNAYGHEQARRANGGDVFQGTTFPFWMYLWGWLWVAGVALAIWLWLRVQAKIREETGIL